MVEKPTHVNKEMINAPWPPRSRYTDVTEPVNSLMRTGLMLVATLAFDTNA